MRKSPGELHMCLFSNYIIKDIRSWKEKIVTMIWMWGLGKIQSLQFEGNLNAFLKQLTIGMQALDHLYQTCDC